MNNDKWIDVREYQPPRTGRYLVSLHSKGGISGKEQSRVLVSIYTKSKGWSGVVYPFEVNAWMYLPKEYDWRSYDE